MDSPAAVQTAGAPRVSVLIPALNEEQALPRVLADLPWPMLHEVVVVDNGSSDRTVERALAGGARVVHASRRGYGAACLEGIRAIGDTDILVFLDGDYSDAPDELPRLLEPIIEDRADLVIGSRELGQREQGAVPPHARFGNWLATGLIARFYGARYTDLGPFRAIRWSSLLGLGMADEDFGWTVEMQIRAAQAGLRHTEVPVSYRKRIGVSKISGNLKGSLQAGWKILYTLAREALRRDRPRSSLGDPVAVSIIVPTLDEEKHLGALLECLQQNTPPFEILVVDGGSGDGTVALAESFPGVRVLRSQAGRARQLNAGAARANGEILWFVHADSRPPYQALRELRRALIDDEVLGGAFRFRLPGEHRGFRIVETGVRVRSEWFGYPYGDQGLFVRRETFHSLGGFPMIPFLEDLHFVRRLRGAGKLSVVPTALETSARRWEQQGALRTSIKNSATFLLDLLGLDPQLTARLYRPSKVR